jgi:hypothetical protein
MKRLLMAKRPTLDDTDPVGEVLPDSELPDTRTPEDRMADRIAEGITRGMAASMPVQKVSYARFDPKTPWQQGKPKKSMPKLSRPCFQNGMAMDDGKMTAEEINLMNSLDTPGRYIDRRVEVVIREDGSTEVVELRYSDTINHAMELKGEIRVAKSKSPLANMLYHIIDEAKGVLVSD